MSFYKKLHSSETGLEIMEKYHTWTFMATLLPVGAVVFLHSEWDCQEVQPMPALSAPFTSVQKGFVYFLITAGLRCFIYCFASGTEATGFYQDPHSFLLFCDFAAKKKEEEEDDDMKELEAWAGTM